MKTLLLNGCAWSADGPRPQPPRIADGPLHFQPVRTSGLLRAETARAPHRAAFSLIEIMVAVTLLSLIVIGLLAVFNHTQRALRMANNQTDVFEGARAAVNLVARDLTALAASGEPGTTNVYASMTTVPMLLNRPGGGLQTNVLQEVYVRSRENDTWTGVGYFVEGRGTSPVGTLFRFSTNAPAMQASFGVSFFDDLYSAFMQSGINDAQRVIDGVVHFELRAYDARGRVLRTWPQASAWPPTNLNASVVSDLETNVLVGAGGFMFRKGCLPAYVEMELGILEPHTTRQFHAIEAAGAAAAKAFLEQQVGKMHLFRQRIPIRNHTQPPAFD